MANKPVREDVARQAIGIVFAFGAMVAVVAFWHLPWELGAAAAAGTIAYLAGWALGHIPYWYSQKHLTP